MYNKIINLHLKFNYLSIFNRTFIEFTQLIFLIPFNYTQQYRYFECFFEKKCVQKLKLRLYNVSPCVYL